MVGPSMPQHGLSMISEGFPLETATSNASTNPNDSVVKEYYEITAKQPDVAIAVAAIRSLTSVIRNSGATTMMGLERELKEAAAALQRCQPTSISLKAGCELFLRYTTRTSELEMEDFAAAKARLIERGHQFADTSVRARQMIADLGARFVRNGLTILTHGNSRVVLAILQRAYTQGINFSVLVTEGRPDNPSCGLKMARALSELNIPVQYVLDSGVAYALESVDLILVGAEGVVENGGVINKLGTYGIALAAKQLGKPLYVAAESYKFARLYPLNQKDLPMETKPLGDIGPLLPANVKVINPSRDYTPPAYISLLVTDLGVLTPAAVSDELIQLYV